MPYPIQRGENGGDPQGERGSGPCGFKISIYTHSGDPVRSADARWCRYLPPGRANPHLPLGSASSRALKFLRQMGHEWP